MPQAPPLLRGRRARVEVRVIAPTARRTGRVTPRLDAEPPLQSEDLEVVHRLISRARAPAGGVRGGRSPFAPHRPPLPAAITHGGSFPARSASRRRVTLSWRHPLSETLTARTPQTKTGPSWARSTSCRAAGYAENDVPHPTGRLRLRVQEREAARQSLLDVIERDSGQVE